MPAVSPGTTNVPAGSAAATRTGIGDMPADSPQFQAVLNAERRHIFSSGRARPVVGLAFSGGGIRSATFNLGVLQALRSLGVFDKIDYLSTVSGGGYIGAWLQAVLARARPRSGADELFAVLPSRLQDPQPEAPDVRFLRQYSNYLTPKLGLFSGDTWAAIGNTARNLLLNFTILSLALMAPLFLPWIGALLFWRVAAGDIGRAALIWPAVLMGIAVATTRLNMKAPLRGGGWSADLPFKASTGWVICLVIGPMLAACWLVAGIAWARVSEGSVGTGAWAPWTFKAGLAYGAVWALGLLAGQAAISAGPVADWMKARRSRRDDAGSPGAAHVDKPAGLGPDDAPDRRISVLQSVRVLAALSFFAVPAGVLGTFLINLFAHLLLRSGFDAGEPWRAALAMFPLSVVALLMAVTLHVGLVGTMFSEQTREWWGRVGGVLMLATGLWMGLHALALYGPHLIEGLSAWGWPAEHRDLVKSILTGLWAAVTGAGVYAGHSSRTRGGTARESSSGQAASRRPSSSPGIC